MFNQFKKNIILIYHYLKIPISAIFYGCSNGQVSNEKKCISFVIFASNIECGLIKVGFEGWECGGGGGFLALVWMVD